MLDSTNNIIFKQPNSFWRISDTDYTSNRYDAAPEEIFGANSVVYSTVTEQTSNIEYKPQYINSFIVLGLIIFLSILYLHSNIANIIKLITNYNFSKKHFEESDAINVRKPTLFVVYTVIVVSLLFHTIFNLFDYFLLFPLALAFGSVLILQSGLLKLSGWVSDYRDLFNEIIFNRNYFLGLIGLIISPLVLLSFLYSFSSKYLLIVQIILIIIPLLLMIIRILKVFSEAKVSYFFCFLYLCAFEISPYLMLLIGFEYVK